MQWMCQFLRAYCTVHSSCQMSCKSATGHTGQTCLSMGQISEPYAWKATVTSSRLLFTTQHPASLKICYSDKLVLSADGPRITLTRGMFVCMVFDVKRWQQIVASTLRYLLLLFRRVSWNCFSSSSRLPVVRQSPTNRHAIRCWLPAPSTRKSMGRSSSSNSRWVTTAPHVSAAAASTTTTAAAATTAATTTALTAVTTSTVITVAAAAITVVTTTTATNYYCGNCCW